MSRGPAGHEFEQRLNQIMAAVRVPDGADAAATEIEGTLRKLRFGFGHLHDGVVMHSRTFREHFAQYVQGAVPVEPAADEEQSSAEDESQLGRKSVGPAWIVVAFILR